MLLFETFKCMDGKNPRAIITDKCPAMIKSVPITFLRTYHHHCIWHILKNEAEKLGALAYRMELYKPFRKCLHDAHSEREFELQWNEK